MLKAGVAGAAGFVGGELIRLLSRHPQVSEIVLQSNSQKGKSVSNVHTDMFDLDYTFNGSIDENVDVLFVSKGHGQSRPYLEANSQFNNAVIIDMSSDYRISEEDNPFVYGLPEWKRDEISKANKIANCGCFATAIQLALLPLLKAGFISTDVHVQGVTGSTGAGAGKLGTTHFSWREGNVSVYKPFTHQHLDEVYQLANALMPGFNRAINFIPMRGNFTRGILISAYTRTDVSLEQIVSIFERTYCKEPFVCLSKEPIHLKQVINTNYCLLHVEKHNGNIMVTACIDNLLKGAAGQAIQNMNIRFGFAESEGLLLKPSAF